MKRSDDAKRRVNAKPNPTCGTLGDVKDFTLCIQTSEIKDLASAKVWVRISAQPEPALLRRALIRGGRMVHVAAIQPVATSVQRY